MVMEEMVVRQEELHSDSQEEEGVEGDGRVILPLLLCFERSSSYNNSVWRPSASLLDS